MGIHDFIAHYQILSLLESLRENLGAHNFMAHTWGPGWGFIDLWLMTLFFVECWFLPYILLTTAKIGLITDFWLELLLIPDFVGTHWDPHSFGDQRNPIDFFQEV